MKIYYYKLTRDYGFAPNPFPPYCTLATCKPSIRRTANINDWVVGIGSSAKGSKYKNKMIYTMKIEEKLTFDEYWQDTRFMRRKPIMNGSQRQKYGDNIYHTDEDGIFIQENSHHSLDNGVVNLINYEKDLRGINVLISKTYWYFGIKAPLLPNALLKMTQVTRGHKLLEDSEDMNLFLSWIESFKETGYIAEPDKFHKNFERYPGK